MFISSIVIIFRFGFFSERFSQADMELFLSAMSVLLIDVRFNSLSLDPCHATQHNSLNRPTPTTSDVPVSVCTSSQLFIELKLVNGKFTEPLVTPYYKCPNLYNGEVYRVTVCCLSPGQQYLSHSSKLLNMVNDFCLIYMHVVCEYRRRYY